MGFGGFSYFGLGRTSEPAPAPLHGSNSTRLLSGESFQKSTNSGPSDVAPGGRFWHGPADLRGRPSGQGRSPKLAPAALAGRRGAEQKNLRKFNDSIMGDCALRSAFDRLRHLGDVVRSESRRRQRAHAGDRGRGRRGRAGLSQ